MTECAENNCGIANNMDLTRSTTAEKKAMAAVLYKTGKWTLEGLGKKFGVTHVAVSKWLNVTEVTNQKHAKTAANPKGAGRPRGRKKKASPKIEKVIDAVEARVRAGETVPRKDIADAFGVGSHTVQIAHARVMGRIETETAQIRPEDLSLTAQQKLEVAIRQRERALEREFNQRVMKEVEHRMETMVLPAWKKTIDWAKAVRQREKGILTAAEYKLLRSCLHPDRVQDADTKTKFTEAFSILERMEKFLCAPEKEPPAKFPRTWQEAQSFA